MRERYVKKVEDELAIQAGLRAVEKKQLPHMLCVTNMLLHGIEDPALCATTTPWQDRISAMDRVTEWTSFSRTQGHQTIHSGLLRERQAVNSRTTCCA
jgi:hypothetical protein